MSEKLIRLHAVLSMTGLSRTTVYDLMRRDGFPKNIPIGQRARAWRESDIQQWILERIEEAA